LITLPNEQRALEEDLELASRIQIGLLPDSSYRVDGWEVAYHYQPAGLVSGDYCDLMGADCEGLHFIVGDVSGKGVAASMLMAHLHAMFRTLFSVNLPLDQLIERASRVFCESTLPTHYATLVCGKACASGAVEICNAGHPPPLLVRAGEVTQIDATGLPLGIFCSEQFSLSRFQMQPGDTLFLYTDGLTETRDGVEGEYGIERLSRLLSEHHDQSPRSLVDNCVGELNHFCSGRARADDLTIMALRRAD
jgi:sigma-B regulation protein RsbU (phosphoserine phosphatase)